MSYTQYVGIGTLTPELDPYARFWGNKYASGYQAVFDAKKCFEVVGATLSKVNAEGLWAETHNKVNSLLNVEETEVIENTLLSSNEVVYTDVEFRVVDGAAIITDPQAIYWTIDESEPSNIWGSARFAYSNQFYAYSSRSLITAYLYNGTNNKLTRITRPEGNVVDLTLTTLYTGGGAYPKAVVELSYDGLDRVTQKRGGDSSTTPILAQVYDCHLLLSSGRGERQGAQ